MCQNISLGSEVKFISFALFEKIFSFVGLLL